VLKRCLMEWGLPKSYLLNSELIEGASVMFVNSYLCTKSQSPSLSFLAEAQSRPETGEGKCHFLAEVHIKNVRRLHELQSKRHHWKNYKFILYLSAICNTIMYLKRKKKHFNKVGFVGFVVNLLNRPTNGATVQRPKKNYFSFAFEKVKLPLSLRAPKKIFKKLQRLVKITKLLSQPRRGTAVK
jgi:hypothetical protein